MGTNGFFEALGSPLAVLSTEVGDDHQGAAVTLGTCGLGDMLDKGRKNFAWGSPRPAPDAAGWRKGKGVVIIQQGSGLPGLDAANAEIRLMADGTFILLSGGADLGTGLDTLNAKAAIAAAAFWFPAASKLKYLYVSSESMP